MKETISLPEFLELAKICQSVYSGPINHKRLKYKNVPLHSQKIVHGSFGRGFCRIFWNDSTLIFAFRGTRENVDWTISNLKIFPKDFNGFEGQNSISVHSGFHNALYFVDKTTRLISLDAIYEHIEDLNLLKDRKVVITGHSLGGALALLFFTKIHIRFNEFFKANTTRIVVFGCPAVGLKKFRDHFEGLNQETIRIVNKADLVPFTPPFFYYHVGEEAWITNQNIVFGKSRKDRIIFALKINPKNLITNHAMENYIASLEQISKKSVSR